jgi:hypothetical protein
MFRLVNATDDETPETGKTATVQISKNGGTFANATNAAVEMAQGFYYVDLTTTETNTDGPLGFVASAPGTNIFADIHQVYTHLLTTTEINRVADIILRRTQANVEGSSFGDALSFRSLYGAAAALVNKTDVSGSTLRVYRSDDTTILGQQAITTDVNAVPVVGLDTV